MDFAARACARILADSATDPYGGFSPSIYETARLVTFAPALAGHEGRMAFLLAEQREDGGWGRPDSYGLLPSLSATEALLTELRRTGDLALGLAAGRGLQALYSRLSAADFTLPDTVAVEILVPGLIADINTQLPELLPGMSTWKPLPDPPGSNPEVMVTWVASAKVQSFRGIVFRSPRTESRTRI